MTCEQKLAILGTAFTLAGSSIAMFGVCFQMNGYFVIRWREIPVQFVLILWRLLRRGPQRAWAQLTIAAGLAQMRGEDRPKSLVGFYLVLVGFFLQTLGSLLLLAAPFVK